MAVLTGVQAEGLAGRVPLRICGESRTSQHTDCKGSHSPPASDKGSVACVVSGQGQKERRQKQDVFLPKF